MRWSRAQDRRISPAGNPDRPFLIWIVLDWKAEGSFLKTLGPTKFYKPMGDERGNEATCCLTSRHHRPTLVGWPFFFPLIISSRFNTSEIIRHQHGSREPLSVIAKKALVGSSHWRGRACAIVKCFGELGVVYCLGLLPISRRGKQRRRIPVGEMTASPSAELGNRQPCLHLPKGYRIPTEVNSGARNANFSSTAVNTPRRPSTMRVVQYRSCQLQLFMEFHRSASRH